MTEEVKNWLAKAYEDFRAAKSLLLLPEDEIPTGVVCFHCQQFVEKALKAFLIHHAVEFGRWHNLTMLKKLCAEKDSDFEKLEIDELSIYAVEVRYPDEFFIPSLEEAKNCFQIAEAVKEFIFKKLKLSEREIMEWTREKRG